MLKRMFWPFVLMLASTLGAQTTVTTATVTDSDSQLWIGGTVTVEFVPSPTFPNPAQYTINGAPLNPAVTKQTANLGGGGNFSLTVYDNTQVSPIGSQWRYTICPNASSKCGILITPIAGTSQNLTTAIDAVIPVPRFQPIAGAYGYNDIEAVIQLLPGSTYWNVTQPCQRYYNGGAGTWACAGSGVITTPCSAEYQVLYSNASSNVDCMTNFTYNPSTGVLSVPTVSANTAILTPPANTPALTMTSSYSSGLGNRGYFNYLNVTGSNTQGYAGYDVVRDFDSLGTGKHMIGHEADCWLTLTPSAYNGCWGYVSILKAAANASVYNGSAFSAESFDPNSDTPPKWNFGFHTNDGQAGFSFFSGAFCAPTIADPTPSCNSQAMGFYGMKNGADQLAEIFADQNGGIFISPNTSGFIGLAGATQALGTFTSPPIATVASTPSASQPYLLQGWNGSAVNTAEVQATGDGDLFLISATGETVRSIGEFVVQGPDTLFSATGKSNVNSHPNIIDNNGFSTASTPDYSYWFESGDGIYHPGYSQIGIAVGGSPGLLVTNNGLGTLTVTVSNLANANGTVIPSTATGYTGTATGKVVLSSGTGYSGTCAATTTLTVVNGIITGCS